MADRNLAETVRHYYKNRAGAFKKDTPLFCGAWTGAPHGEHCLQRKLNCVNPQQAFDQIVASIHEAAVDETRWPATSLLIDEAFGARGNGLLAGQRVDGDVRVRYEGLYWRGERREDLEREYLETYHPLDERVARLRRLPDSRVVRVRELYSAVERKTSPTYNEMLPRSIGQNALNVRLDLTPGSHLTFCLCGPQREDAWGSGQLHLLERLLPHVRQFAHVRRALASAEALNASLSELLDNSGIGVIHLRRSGRIMSANDRARELLEQGRGIWNKDGFLRPWLSADCDELERLLARALPAWGRQGVGGSMALRRPSHFPLILQIIPVTESQMTLGVSDPGALVLVLDAASRPGSDAGRVAAALGLTTAEGRVAILLAEGRTVRDIAALTGRRENTIRAHLRHIHRKLDISRRADLVRLVLAASTLRDSRPRR